MKVHLELFVRGTTMERKECYEDVQICKTEMDKERKREYIFSGFFSVVGFRDISVVLWYAEKWCICQSYLTYFSYYPRHNIFGMLCERFALVKQWQQYSSVFWYLYLKAFPLDISETKNGSGMFANPIPGWT